MSSHNRPHRYDPRTCPPLTHCTERWIGTNIPVNIGESPVFLQTSTRGKTGHSVLFVGGKPFTSARAHKSSLCPDPEKLATLISLKRGLAFVGTFPLPAPAPALMRLAAQLLALRIEAQKQGGQKGAEAKARFEKLLHTARNSPSRVVRAFAAGLQELLK